MNVTPDLIHIVEQAHSLARILDAATRVVAQRLGADGCCVFLLEEDGDLVRSDGSSGSLKRSERADAEAAAVAAQVTAERRVATVHAETTSLLASPMLLRDSVVGALVLQSTGRRDYSVEDVETIAEIGAQLVGIVENARLIEALDRGDRPRPPATPRRSSTEPRDGERTLRGSAAPASEQGSS